MRLDRVTGHECPECGCSQSELIKRVARWGRPADRRRCGHCGRTFDVPTEPDEEAEEEEDRGTVVYLVLRCPDCGSDRVPVTSSRRPIRHHKCAECGLAFKSVESRAEKPL